MNLKESLAGVFCGVGGAAWLALMSGVLAAEAVDVPRLTAAINAVGPEGAGHPAAIAAWNELVRAEAAQIPQILAGMDADRKLAVNWLRGVVEAIAQRHVAAGGKLPLADLARFIADTSHAPPARRLAYELLLAADPEMARRLLSGMLNDPSLELRRDSVAVALAQARAVLDAGQKSEARIAYRQTLTAARDQDQIEEAAARLRGLGETVDLAEHFGFIQHWKLVGPFDNTGMRGFDVVYGPEQNPDPQASYEGKDGTVQWFDAATADPYGMLDLNKIHGRHKGAIDYAYAEFKANEPRDVELRLGCITANKVWLNGQLLTANNVYHANTFIDQYVGRGRLQAGKNVILLKIAQNEQTEDWAQRWQFQLRVCDQYGTAVLSTDRRPAVPASTAR